MRCRLAYVIVSVIMLCFLSPNVIAQTNQNQQTLPEAVQDKAETIKDETGLKSISSEQYDAIIIVMLVIVLWGTISGFRQNTTVFYNFDDLALCFGMILKMLFLDRIVFWSGGLDHFGFKPMKIRC